MPSLITMVFLSLLLGTAARADYQDGVRAYETGRYDEAIAAFRPLSERGDPDAEFMLGVLYFYGRGVVRDDSLAAIWFYKAARKGNPSAQLAFGSLHIRGTGVQQDLVKAYLWLTLAAESGIPALAAQAIILRDDAARLMTPEEIERGRKRAAAFKPVKAGLSGKE